MAEIGMHRGASDKIICRLKGDKRFFGLDTFEGLAHIGRDGEWVRKGEYRASQETVTAYLSEFPGAILTKGLFLETGAVLREEHLSFIHLDIDVYKDTIDSLNFLWPRTSDRGLILIHDTHLEGVKKAEEFLSAHTAMAFRCGCMQIALIRV
jgi:O-methyltransferase